MVKDVFESDEEFSVEMASPEIIRIRFGAVSVDMTLDAAQDFQYKLVSFVAEQERLLSELDDELESDGERSARSECDCAGSKGESRTPSAWDSVITLPLRKKLLS